MRRGWSQVHHACGNARQTPQAVRVIQISQQRHNSLGSQFRDTGRAGSQCDHTHVATQQAGNTLPHIATTDDQDAFTPESGWQSA
jgi:hypothetical protein